MASIPFDFALQAGVANSTVGPQGDAQAQQCHQMPGGRGCVAGAGGLCARVVLAMRDVWVMCCNDKVGVVGSKGNEQAR